jgi:hypothetical protein
MMKRNTNNPFGSVLEQIARSKAERARRAEFFNTTRETIERAIAPDASTLAAAILRAAAKARGEIADPPPDLSPLARAILNAGRKRRNEPLL